MLENSAIADRQQESGCGDEVASLPVDTIIQGDCLTVMPTLPNGSIDLICTDPPYFKVKNEQWDRQWSKPEQFLAWVDALCAEWRRLLKPNGSLYVFASPYMAARVEVVISKHFHVLNQIVWRKEQGRHKRAHKEGLRSYFPSTERIIFAEHYNSDNYALDGSGYASKCDELRGFVFEPIRAYLENERKRAGIEREACNRACQTRSMAARHFFTHSQWCLPTKEQYAALQKLFNEQGKKPVPPFVEFHPQGYWTRYHTRGRDDYLRADYEYLRRGYDYLRADYEYLRAEYEHLRRPFYVSADVPYTDVWMFETVASYPGKHPCEKPLPLLEPIIQASTRPGALILDCFAGSGSLCEAAQRQGRHFLAIERHAPYVAQARARVSRKPVEMYPLQVPPASVVSVTLRHHKPIVA